MDEQTRTVTVPGPRDPMPAEMLPSLRGRVVMLLAPQAEQTWTYGYMALDEIHDCGGHACVTVVPARQFWQHELLGAVPTERLHWDAACVFVV